MQQHNWQIVISLDFDSFLLAGRQLDEVQAVLRELAPRWSSKLHVWRHRQEKTPIDLSIAGSLAQAVRLAATERGPLFRDLECRYGQAPLRVFGGAELRGADTSLVLGVDIDEQVFQRLGEKWIWANRFTIQTCRPKVEGTDGPSWCASAFEALCDRLGPVWGHTEITAEYDAKNISREGGGMMAIGVDFSRCLPGVYWLNFYGRTYRDFIGRERLLSAPAYDVREVGDGVLLRLHADPTKWDSPEYQATERQVLAHVGPQFFFSRQNPDRVTVAPDFGLPILRSEQQVARPPEQPRKLQEGVWWRFKR
jgi:hypothetical protein